MSHIMTNKKQGHEISSGRICHWFFCTKCGIVYLNNKATRKYLKKPCPGAENDLNEPKNKQLVQIVILTIRSCALMARESEMEKYMTEAEIIANIVKVAFPPHLRTNPSFISLATKIYKEIDTPLDKLINILISAKMS